MTFQLSALLNYLCYRFFLFVHPRADHGKRLYDNRLSHKTWALYYLQIILSIGLLFTRAAGIRGDREAPDKM